MSHDDPTPGPTPGPTPEEEQVRRLLADARHTEPMPDDVAERLDAVLADLGRGRAEAGAEPAPAAAVVDLAARRRRTARSLLVAAAAVVAVGIAVTQLPTQPGSGDADSAGSGDANMSQEEADQDDAGRAAESEPRAALAGPVRLRSDRFDVQVARLQGLSGAFLADKDAVDLERLTEQLAMPYCPGGRGRGRSVPVRYDGKPGVLVFRPVASERQRVDLYLCHREGPVRSTTLPAP